MLIYTSTGATIDGQFLVTYQTPGCHVSTVARICTTQAQADGEAVRLNKEQADTEHALKVERARCGLVCALECDHGR
jgi:hypothetical protein